MSTSANYEENDLSCTPPDIRCEALNVMESLLPETSKEKKNKKPETGCKIPLIHSSPGNTGKSCSALDTAYEISSKASRSLPLASIMADIHRHNPTVSGMHMLSGVVPFALAVVINTEKNTEVNQVIDFCLIGNILALTYHAIIRRIDWGWYTAGAATIAYFVANQEDRFKYPLALVFFEYCVYSLFGWI